MKRKLKGNLLLLVLLFSFFDVLGFQKIKMQSEVSRLNSDTVVSPWFRDHMLNKEMISFMGKSDNPALLAGLYLLESKGSYNNFPYPYTKQTMLELQRKWAVKREWADYLKVCDSIWSDLKYFPVPISSIEKSLRVSYTNSWMNKRTFGGERGHEGTDLMASKNERGIYPVLSMTDGVVTSKGWLPKGGWRIGITSPGGCYYYYAHLASYGRFQIGDEVKAGDLLGYMGDSGYGEEGTIGKFPVHLHVGIYQKNGNEEISINPYWILKYLEKRKLVYTFS